MSSAREVLRQKLERFYQKYDPSKLKGTVIEKLVDYALAEGLEALNQGLMRKYGDYLDSGSEEYLLEDGYNERDSLLFNIELYYVIHDPSKLTKPEDIEAILEWAIFHGVEKLNAKMVEKYKADLFDATLEEAQKVVARYYKSRGEFKSEEQVAAIVNWAAENSFVELNNKLVEKYGVALGETQELTPEEKLREKLGTFYATYDPTKLDDADNMAFIVAWGLKYGEKKLNAKLQKRYNANLNSMPKKPPPAAPRAPEKSQGQQQTSTAHATAAENEEDIAAARKTKKRNRKSKRRSTAAEEDDDDDIEDEDINRIVEADEKKITRIRRLVELFYGKHDPERLLEEGVSPIIQFAIVKGEEELNEKLKLKYREDLKDIEEQYLNNKRKMKKFYEMYDPSKLEGDQFEILLGRTTINGINWLNAKLMRKYDDDTDFTGLKKRIKLFYERVGAAKNDIQIANIADWALQKGIGRLNKKMKKKYGISLEDVYLVEAPVEDGDEDEEGKEEEYDDEDEEVASQDLEADYREEEELEIGLDNLASEKTIEVFAITEEDEKILDGINFELEEEAEEEERRGKGRSSFLDIEEENVEEEKKVDILSNNLVKKIQTFYRRHNPEYGANLANIKKDVDFVLQNGVERYNRELIEKYGESLRSVLGRKQTLAKFKVDKKNGFRDSRDARSRAGSRVRAASRAHSKVSKGSGRSGANDDIQELV